MHLLGITGGVGMGKSAAEHLLCEQGIPVADTDAIARGLVTPGQPALDEIIQVFGNEFLDALGKLRRTALASLVFSDSEARTRLESILHPRIRARWTEDVESWRRNGVRLAGVVIPLLFETDAGASFDSVVCIACTEATQRRRLIARGWDAEQISQRIASQWPIERKMASADFVIWTEGDLELHQAQWMRLLALLSG